jgi:RNA polymerase sigma factor (sigma-70 family)
VTPNENANNEKLRDLLVRLQAAPKNEQLWAELYRHVRRFVYAVAYRALSGNEELAKDATQNVFMRLFVYLEFTEFTEPEEFLAYIATVARNAALDLRRVEGKYVTGLDLTLCDCIPGTATPEQHERAKRSLHEVLEQLEPAETRLVNLLMQGFSLDEIASQLGISYANAAVRIHRLREKMLKRMKTS